MQHRKRDIYNYTIIAIAFLYYQFYYINNAIWFYNIYPWGYMWQEYFISYAGGLVRRGIVGSILFFLAEHGINIHLFVPIFIYFYTVALVIYCIKEIYSNIDTCISLFIILSPGCLFFLFYDAGEFARRDIFTISFFIIIMYIISKFRIRFFLLICISLFIFLGVMIHEALIFYLPAPVFILYLKFKKENIQNKYFFIYCLFLLIPICIFILSFPGTVEHIHMISQHWSTIIDDFKAGGGLSWIGRNIKESSGIINHIDIRSWRNAMISSYILTFSPIIFLVYKYKLYTKIIRSFSYKFEFVFFIASLMSPFLWHFVALDGGRGIFLHHINILFFIIYLSKINNININDSNFDINICAIVALATYSLSWHLFPFSNNYDYLLPIFILILILDSFFKANKRI